MKAVNFIISWLFFLVFILNLNSIAQNTTSISGFIYDTTNGESLPGANIFITELNTGSSTNQSGYFVIPNVSFNKYTLRISYIGYKTIEKRVDILLNSKNVFNFFLTPQSIETETIIVTGDTMSVGDKLFIKPISRFDLSPQQVNQMPRLIEADLLRTLQTLPGITALSDFSSALYVRGGTPDQNLYMIDGTDVYNPEHAFGIFSTFNTYAIKKVEISKGGFSADYGGRLSSVIDVTNIDGNRNKFQGVANVSLLSASTTLQIPLGDFGSISGSLRRTYIDQTYAKWFDEIPNYYFLDGNIKAFFDINENNKLSVSFFRSYDDLEFRVDKTKKNSFGFDYDWGNTTGSINWKHIFNPEIFSSFWITGSSFKSCFDMRRVMNMIEENFIYDISLKAALEYYGSTNLYLKFGAEHKFLYGSYKMDWDAGYADVERHRNHSIGYLSLNYRPLEDWSFEAGLRGDYFNSDKNYFNISPRLTIRYKLNESSSLKFATGIYYQYLYRIPRLFFNAIWTSADEYTRESNSNHFILGYQKEIDKVYEFEIETYWKTYKNICQFNNLYFVEAVPNGYTPGGAPIYSTTKNLFNSGYADSYGLEFLLRKQLGEITGWISYSLSRTNYTFEKLNSGKQFIPRHNRTHIVNVVLNTSINDLLWPQNEHIDKWFLGINFIYSSGQPITVPGSAYYVTTLPDWNDIPAYYKNTPSYKLYPAGMNSFSLPAYTRLDISITYEIQYDGWKLSPYLQIINIGNRQNVWFINYNDKYENKMIIQEVDETDMFPILPSIG
ncbi:MAG: TonB-dependent receptor, partial [Ignavibacteriales bacterium]|nr:TonB-dependent receptor [Ignavibacteriales bacterium]